MKAELLARAVAAVAIATTGAGCSTLPRSGPLASQLTTADAAAETPEGLVAPLTAEAAAAAAARPEVGFPESFHAAATIDPERIGVGDVLDVTIWETGADGLFGGEEGAGALTAVVDSDGGIYVPFAGELRAVGMTPSSLRRRIQSALEPLTLSPQVDVRLREPRSRGVTVQGAVARPGAYVLDRGALRLVPLLALAGGATVPAEQVEVAIRRSGAEGAETLEDVYVDPALDVALAPDDRIVLNPIRERFVVLGATSLQAELTFPTRQLSLLSALAAARGLRDFDADPESVFVLRREEEALADALLPGPEPEGLPAGAGRPIAYRLDLTRPEAMFVASQFQMRDGDAIFVSNAPVTELRKLLSVFTTVLAPVQSGTALNTQLGG